MERTALLMFTVRLCTCKEKGRGAGWKRKLDHQCFIYSDLWIFHQQMSSSNANQVHVADACRELDCVCRLLGMYSQSSSRASRHSFLLCFWLRQFLCRIVGCFWAASLSSRWLCIWRPPLASLLLRFPRLSLFAFLPFSAKLHLESLLQL